jgi:hypothetical protein
LAVASHEHAGHEQDSPQQAQPALVFATVLVQQALSVFSTFAVLAADEVQQAAPPPQSHAWPATFDLASQVQAGQAHTAPQQAQSALAFAFVSAALAETPVNAARARAATVPISLRRFIFCLLFSCL